MSAENQAEPTIIALCKFCGSCAATIAAAFADFDCGTTWSEIEGFDRSHECEERQHAQDMEADDEINRWRMARHFEYRHWGI